MKARVLTVLGALCALAQGCQANDPAGSWLNYASWTSSGEARITALNTTWKVPSNPNSPWGSNAPGWWFGIQTTRGDGALIQPILAWGYQGSQWSIFNGVFDWTDGSWRTSDEVYRVSAGDEITSSVIYKGDRTYTMIIEANGRSISTDYTLQQGQHSNETTAYFVLEHQPDSCNAYPSSDSMTFDNIVLEVDGQVVDSPKWAGHAEQPACDSSVKVLSSSQIQFSWNHQGAKQSAPEPSLSRPMKWGQGV